MRAIVLALMLLPTALPAAAQTTLGVRAGLGSARLVLSDNVVFGPCPPDADCPGFATGSARSLTLGADVSVPLAGDAVEIRVGAAYSEKGGAASGRDADGNPLPRRALVGLPSDLAAAAPSRPRAGSQPAVGGCTPGPMVCDIVVVRRGTAGWRTAVRATKGRGRPADSPSAEAWRPGSSAVRVSAWTRSTPADWRKLGVSQQGSWRSKWASSSRSTDGYSVRALPSRRRSVCVPRRPESPRLDLSRPKPVEMVDPGASVMTIRSGGNFVRL